MIPVYPLFPIMICGSLETDERANEKIIDFRGEVEIGLGRFLSFTMCYLKF